MGPHSNGYPTPAHKYLTRAEVNFRGTLQLTTAAKSYIVQAQELSQRVLDSKKNIFVAKAAIILFYLISANLPIVSASCPGPGFSGSAEMTSRCQCHKNFYGRKLRLFIISQSVCPLQAFPAQPNVDRLDQCLPEWSTSQLLHFKVGSWP